MGASPPARAMPPRKKRCVASPDAETRGDDASESSAVSDGDFLLNTRDLQQWTIPIELSFQATTFMLKCVVAVSFETFVVM